MNDLGAPSKIRTCGLLLRRQSLYPLSYRGHAEPKPTWGYSPAAPAGRGAEDKHLGAAHIASLLERVRSAPDEGGDAPAQLNVIDQAAIQRPT